MANTGALRWRVICGALMCAALAGGAETRAADDLPDYKNAGLSFKRRVADLVSRMTLAEKAEQVQIATTQNARLGIPACNW